ncbi:MAG: hypothetical protein AAF378_18470 [Cyanobacteria bacterium P01_A01_bin.84]
MEHLKKSGNITFNSPNQNSKVSQPVTPTPTPTPTPPKVSNASTAAATPNLYKTPDTRKRQIMEHLSRSGANYNLSSLGLEARKQKIQNHVRKSIE